MHQIPAERSAGRGRSAC